ncbi:MAG: hypothetical protein KIT72_16950 [Polyangiaceae bacterium]|nr:hypothetical protein [Polyangiaceae bacterium]MCW5792108.1 hypothetical protein [Polyangiaceae bacterium]
MSTTASLSLLVTLTGLFTFAACGGGAPAPAEPTSVDHAAPETAGAEDPSAPQPPNDRAPTPMATGSAAPPLPSASGRAPRQFGMLTEQQLVTPLSRVASPLPVVATTEDYARWRVRRQIRVGTSHLSFAERSLDERHVVAMGYDQKVRTYDITNGKLVATTQLAANLHPLGLWPDGTAPYGALLAVGGEHRNAHFIDLNGEARGELAGPGASDLRWTRDMKIAGLTTARVPAQTGNLHFVNDDGETLLRLESRERIEDWALSGDGQRLSVTYYPSDTVEVIDLEAGRVLFSHAVPKYTNSIDLSPDGRFLAVAGAEVWVFPLASPTEVQTYKGLKNNAHRVRFSPSGDALVVSSYDGHARVLKLGSSSELQLVKALRHAGTANVYAAEFSPDGTTLLTSSGDQTLILWGK